MNDTVSVKLPREIGEQLRALSRSLQRPVTDTIASLLILGAQQWRVPLPIPGVVIESKPDGVCITVDDFAFSPLSPEQTVSLAHSFIDALERSVTVLNLNPGHPDMIEVQRIGSGISISVTRQRIPEFRRVFSRGATRLLVHQMMTVASKAAIHG